MIVVATSFMRTEDSQLSIQRAGKFPPMISCLNDETDTMVFKVPSGDTVFCGRAERRML